LLRQPFRDRRPAGRFFLVLHGFPGNAALISYPAQPNIGIVRNNSALSQQPVVFDPDRGASLDQESRRKAPSGNVPAEEWNERQGNKQIVRHNDRHYCWRIFSAFLTFLSAFFSFGVLAGSFFGDFFAS
jgi:hypothetical protein